MSPPLIVSPSSLVTWAIATGLSPVGGAEQEAEGITAVHTVPWPEVLAMVSRGEVSDGETVAALMYAALALGRVT